MPKIQKKKKQYIDPFTEGYSAFNDDKSGDANPYKVGTEQYIEWDAGFEKACNDFMDADD